jgi:homocysteine S-methyltransferase
MPSFLENLRERVLCGDGAIGTLLAERGVPAGSCFEELCLTRPDLIAALHSDYLAAGAEIVTTDSFGANALKLASFGLEGRVREINTAAAAVARRAVADSGKTAWVAGSVGPLGLAAGDTSRSESDREAMFRDQIGGLLAGGADLILLETFQDPVELLLALRVAKSLGSTPVVTSLAVPESGRLPGGTEVAEALKSLSSAGADLVGLNCVNGPQAMLRLMEKISPSRPLALFPNAGRPSYQEGRITYGTSPEYFADLGRRMAEAGAALIGGCCGTSPEHIRALSGAIRGRKPAPRHKPSVVTVEERVAVRQTEEESLLDLVAAGKTVIVTELDPPKTLPLEKFFHAAEAITRAGSDAITLADNSLAILRVSNFAVAALLKQKGITPLLHLSCRDKNVIGLQSELLGMAALGMRHVLALTGDPAKGGDHPDATSVYDVNSVGLLGIIRRLNEGFTQAGTDLQARPDLVAGCTFNPNSRNLDAQVQKLERKVAAGARYVMTQPVFETRLVEETARRTAHLGIPVFTGVWPLLNGRQAKFLHNEVPGISIPDNVMARMEGLEGDAGRKEGVAVAKEVTRSVLDHFPGVYFMTPFLAYQTTEELCAFVRGR